jgi:FRG domain-containing protein
MAGAPSDSPVNSLTEYIDRIKQLRAFWKIDRETRYGEIESIWFRGHEQADWKLTPRLYRPEYRGSSEAEIRQEFQIRAQQLLQGGRLPADKWEWYFLMQHYGAPTRLLDWTDNPLVALYFALHSPKDDDSEPDTAAAVWVLNSWWLNRRSHPGIEGPMLSDWGEAQAYLPDLQDAFAGYELRIRRPAAIDPPHVDRRLAAQGSHFVIFGHNYDLMRTKAARSKRERTRQITKITINRRSTPGLRADLELCGITRPLLFPDLQALCDDISRKCRRPD